MRLGSAIGLAVTIATCLIGLALLLGGCANQNLTTLTEALSKDPASACMSLGTPYGTLALGRAVNDKVRVTISGGQCTVDHRTE